MSQMLPEGGEVMRRAACGEVCPAPPLSHTRSENKELLRQQLLSAKERHSTAPAPAPPAAGAKPRSRQKNRWKLKFHHQALPQEYLDHYEQTLQRQARLAPAPVPTPAPAPKQDKTKKEDSKIWAQKHTDAHNMASKDKKKPTITPNKIVTYDDLPYMGEMTLNNCKPRRGRKPKKADICHLIYENYGTVVPGQPPPGRPPPALQAPPALPSPKTDLQNKIISSLLERKLSQENKKRLEMSPQGFGSPEGLVPVTPRGLGSPDTPALSAPRALGSPDSPAPAAPRTTPGPLHSDDEPLNLCIRDLHELKIQIQKKFGNIYCSLPDVKTEPEEDQTEQPNAISVIQRNTNLQPTPTAASSPGPPSPRPGQHRNTSPALSEPGPVTADGDKFPNCVYWPNALYMHPLALQTQLMYYQRLAAAGQMPFQEEPSTPESTASSPVEDSKNKLVLKEISELLDPKVVKQVEAAKSPDPTKKRASPNPGQGPVKRKRSAIFIPPVPAKSNSTTPTTEVSICKFKFTGGSKPSLLEKKMLSVDSGGNFRYYSGTGNKGNKGYEYLHKDASTVQSEPQPLVLSKEIPVCASTSKDDAGKKKRKSRKSLQREKLEQTFKEKGFLIQTQQLQSAEGATYCKFRQLRKFTRYLFRSWKDYLPGELEGANPEERPEPQASGSSLNPPVPEQWR